jgi:predicted lipoprotein
MNFSYRFSPVFILILFAFLGCDKQQDKPDTNAERKALLENIGNNIILPSYQALATATSQLNQQAEQFAATPTTERLATLQQAWKDAAMAWQKAETFEFGPAERRDLRMQVNAFPTSTTKIESAITSGADFTPAYMTSLDAYAKGFPALDYLLFSMSGDNAEVLSRYTTEANAAKRKQFLTAITKFINDHAASVANEWSSATGGNYINTFTSNTGTDVGSSIGYLVNQMNYHLEIVINQKIGVPAGKRSNGTIFPQRVEGLYSKTSLPLIEANLTHLHHVFLGISANGDGAGLAEYLTALGAKDSQGTPLAESINAKMASAMTAVKAIPPTLPETIATNLTPVDRAFNELKSLLVPFKVDMPSAIGTSITYIDNDGD